MVFENLTLFEVNLENSRFSASRGGSSSEETESFESESYEDESSDVETESESGGGRSKALPIGLLLVLVVSGLAFRRYRSGGDGEEAGDVDDTGGITIEQAAEQ